MLCCCESDPAGHALGVVDGESSSYQVRGRAETPRRTMMSAFGTEEGSSEESSEWVPGAAFMGSHAIQTEQAEIEKLFRRTKPYCAIVLDRGCARAVKGMKIEAAAADSGEDSGFDCYDKGDERTDRETGSWSRLTVL